LCGGWGKVKLNEEEVTERWKVLYKEYLNDLNCLLNCTGWCNTGELNGSTHGGCSNKSGVYEIINNKGRDVDLSGPGS